MTISAPAHLPPPAYRSAGRGRRMLPPALVVGGLAAATLALHLRDPHSQGSWGECPTLAWFGVYCPGCGGLRAVNDLSNAQVGAAASSNLVFVLCLPLIAYAFVRWAHGRWTGRPWQPSVRSVNIGAGLLIVAVIVFTVLRNTGAGSWLAP